MGRPRVQAQARSQKLTTQAKFPTRPPLPNRATPVQTPDLNSALSQGPTRAQLMPPAAAPASELVSVSPASSRPSSSQRFAYTDNSTDETVLSSRSSLSSERISPFEPSELTAKRDVYDFKLKRDVARARGQGSIVTRQLRAMTLRNTLELGIDTELAESADKVQRLSAMEQQSAETNSRTSKSQRRRARRQRTKKVSQHN